MTKYANARNAAIEPVKALLHDRVKTYALESICDERGELMPVELKRLGFEPVHLAVIRASDGSRRGGHAHKVGRQALLCIAGRVDLDLAVAGEQAACTLDDRVQLAVIEPGVWARQAYFGANPALALLLEHPYDPENYIQEPQ